MLVIEGRRFTETTQQRQELFAAVVAVGIISEYSAAS